ncbi:unnamed protein product [Linum trigynum]|uniref:Reverse transcriptase domain-containing protein n=1 Tax=Linum trigynum TaxID=586398 RepID=A0AAV2GSG0_9ROSI
MMMKLDMRKAYYLVEWEFLISLLRAYGFSEVWCGRVRSCISTVKFRLLFNGEPSAEFQPSKGIRQGDPLSPLLFILMSNALSFLIKKAPQRHVIKGLKLNRSCPSLTHCLFADDTIIFGEASVSEEEKILSILNDYGSITGQEVNREKSSMFFSYNVPIDEQEGIVQTSGFAASICHSKYLGVPTEWGRSKKETFQFLLHRMETRGESWKSLLLSPGGKEVLLKVVFQAIPSFIKCLFLLPRSTMEKMDAMLKNFFWGGSLSKKTIHWRAGHDSLCPERGGRPWLPTFPYLQFSTAGQTGMESNHKLDALWVKVLKSIYFPHSDFLNAKKGGKASWIWVSLWEAKKRMK